MNTSPTANPMSSATGCISSAHTIVRAAPNIVRWAITSAGPRPSTILLHGGMRASYIPPTVSRAGRGSASTRPTSCAGTTENTIFTTASAILRAASSSPSPIPPAEIIAFWAKSAFPTAVRSAALCPPIPPSSTTTASSASITAGRSRPMPPKPTAGTTFPPNSSRRCSSWAKRASFTARRKRWKGKRAAA